MNEHPSETQDTNEERPIEGPFVDADLVELFSEAADAGERDLLIGAIADMHPADVADVLEQMSTASFTDAVRMLGNDLPSETLAELSEDVQRQALELLPDAAVVGALEELDSDDAADVASQLDEGRQKLVLDQINAGDRAAIETSLTFDEETAGRLMQRDFVAAPEFWSVGQAIDHMRSAEDLPEPFFEVYLVDPAFHLRGVVPLSLLVQASRDVMLSDLRLDLSASVHPNMDQEEVAYIFQQYNLASAPVLDEDGRLTGMITIDDMVDVIQEENKEDLLALSGVNDGSATQSAMDAVRSRAPWLAVNLVTAFLASGVISLFEGTLEQIIALAVLMPVVAALGGNAGSQALAVTVRAIAERDLMGAMAGRAVRRELATAIIHGIIFSIGVAGIALIWFRSPELSAVIGAAMFCTFVWAGLAGVLVPLTLQRFGADPAVASSVFVLTSVDIIGFCTFLGLASAVLL